MTVNSEFQYVHAVAVTSQWDESAIRCTVSSKRWCVTCCSS